MMTAEYMLEQALQMRPAEKFMLIDGLLQSLDEPDKTLEEIWAIEAEKRLNAYKAGRIKTVSFEEVFGAESETRILNRSN